MTMRAMSIDFKESLLVFAAATLGEDRRNTFEIADYEATLKEIANVNL